MWDFHPLKPLYVHCSGSRRLSGTMAERHSKDFSLFYMNELASRIIAESGIPSDRFHLGKLILQALKDYPDAICQIEGTTGESTTNKYVMNKSVKCAKRFNKLGLKIGDVVAIMSASNLDLCIPFYASLFIGAVVAPVDTTYSISEIVNTFNVIEPKIIFCQSSRAPDIQRAMNEIGFNAPIVSFDKGDYLWNLDDFLLDDDSPEEDFKVTDFDPSETSAFLLPTSGTTGLPKSAESTHKNYAIVMPYLWSEFTNFPSPVSISMMYAPLQWLTTLYQYVNSPIYKITRLESSLPMTADLAEALISKYRPENIIISPTFMTTIMKNKERFDLTSFKRILIGGNAVPVELIEDINKATPSTLVLNAYGMTELCGLGFLGHMTEQGICGKPFGYLQYRLVDNVTGQDILEPNTNGELWLKGPSIIKGYYKNEIATRETFSEDKWLKSGDLFYKDKHENFYFVERIKLMFKYQNYQISPVEIETVIRKHPGVLDVAVTSVYDEESGDLPVACIVLRPGYNNITDSVINLVKESLSDAKQLRGGVVYMDSLPVTATTKIDRMKLKKLVKDIKNIS